jgi:hypothetical protein
MSILDIVDRQTEYGESSTTQASVCTSPNVPQGSPEAALASAIDRIPTLLVARSHLDSRVRIVLPNLQVLAFVGDPEIYRARAANVGKVQAVPSILRQHLGKVIVVLESIAVVLW